MSFETMFFDLDETLYPATSGIWQAIGSRMDTFIMDLLKIPQQEVSELREELFLEYGTTLRGLSTRYGIDEKHFLDFVHDIPINRYLQEDLALVDTLSLYSARKVIFTNANKEHAERVLAALGIEEFFPEIIDILQLSPYCKPLTDAFQKAIEISGIVSTADCVMIDDSPRNLATAREMGFFTIQVGTDIRCPHADAAILTIADLPDVIPTDKPAPERF